MQCLAHVHSRYSVTRQEIQKIKPQISRIRARKRGSLAAPNISDQFSAPLMSALSGNSPTLRQLLYSDLRSEWKGSGARCEWQSQRVNTLLSLQGRQLYIQALPSCMYEPQHRKQLVSQHSSSLSSLQAAAERYNWAYTTATWHPHRSEPRSTALELQPTTHCMLMSNSLLQI
jgi:hypothetical protein